MGKDGQGELDKESEDIAAPRDEQYFHGKPFFQRRRQYYNAASGHSYNNYNASFHKFGNFNNNQFGHRHGNIGGSNGYYKQPSY